VRKVEQLVDDALVGIRDALGGEDEREQPSVAGYCVS
jgi:hypothetical protein